MQMALSFSHLCEACKVVIWLAPQSPHVPSEWPCCCPWPCCPWPFCCPWPCCFPLHKVFPFQWTSAISCSVRHSRSNVPVLVKLSQLNPLFCMALTSSKWQQQYLLVLQSRACWFCVLVVYADFALRHTCWFWVLVVHADFACQSQMMNLYVSALNLALGCIYIYILVVCGAWTWCQNWC